MRDCLILCLRWAKPCRIPCVTELKENTEKLTFQVIPEIKEAACILYKGSYDNFAKAYQAALRWIDSNGYETCEFPRESYIDGVWNKESEDDWLTEIQFPVRKRQ